MLFQIEMLLDPRVIFNFSDDGINNVLSDPQLRLNESDEVFAVIGAYPHAILEPQKAESLHHFAQSDSRPSSLLGYIKHHDAKFTIPASLGKRGRVDARFFNLQGSSAYFRYFKQALRITLHVTLNDQTSQSILRLKPHLVILLAHERGKCLQYIGSEHCDGEHSSYANHSQHGFLNLLAFSPCSRIFFDKTHITKYIL